jgi:O-antigen/teichoic acid export membrane protein
MERLANPTEKNKNEIVRTTYILLLAFLVILIISSLAAPLFFRLLVDPRYLGAVKYVFWVGLSYFFWGVYILFTGYIFYTKKTGFLGTLAILNIVLNLVLNYYLIQYFGALGAAYATCISFFVIAVLVVWKAVRLFDLPWLEVISRRRPGGRLYSQSADQS